MLASTCQKTNSITNMDNDLIKVLWVEDNPGTREEFPGEAEDHGIDLIPFECWDDARTALLRDFDSYDAIILDAKCKLHKDSIDNAIRFLPEVIADLGEIFAQRKRHINWYVLSGEIGENDINPIPEKRKQWDGDWPKDYYSKNTDRLTLYSRIREHVERSNANQIKTILYPEVFRAIDKCGLDKSAAEVMVSLLEPMHFAGTSEKDYNYRFAEARKILEFIFRSMIDNGIIPPSYRTVSKGKDGVNLTWCSRLLAGKPHDLSNTECVGAVCSRIIAKNIEQIINTSGSFVHTTAAKQDTESDGAQYLQDVGNTTFLLKSFALQLCDIILWYENYLTKHPDAKENAKNWNVF